MRSCTEGRDEGRRIRKHGSLLLVLVATASPIGEHGC